MSKKILFILIFSLYSFVSFSQNETGVYFDLGVEAQQYPTGFLLGARAEIGIASHHALDVRIGYNSLDHKDFGEHESEIGGGFGFTLGYRYYFKPENRKWFLGARSDFWWNEIDWEDNIRNPNQMVGTTNVVVLQPTAIGGYRFLLNNNFVITPTLAFGAEINIKTEGEDVGQGAIVLWGINLGYKF